MEYLHIEYNLLKEIVKEIWKINSFWLTRVGGSFIIIDFSKMRILGKTTVRGPYSEYEKKRIASLIDSHSFNTQVSCFLPFLDSIPNNTNTQQEKKKIE